MLFTFQCEGKECMCISLGRMFFPGLECVFRGVGLVHVNPALMTLTAHPCTTLMHSCSSNGRAQHQRCKILFTWLLYLSIILGDFYFIQVQFKLTTCTFTWLHFWRKNSTFYSLQFYFNVKSTLHFYFILCTLNMVNGISKVHAWRENQWSLFSCIKHTVLLQLWLSSGKCLGSKIHHQI